MNVPRGVGFVEAIFAFEGKIAWVIDVWDCHGVLKKQSWGVGRGCMPELPKGFEWRVIGEGWFSLPIKKDMELSESQEKMIEKVLFEAVNRYGMINKSGIYPVYSSDLERLDKALQGNLKLEKTENIVNRILDLLKKNPNRALLVWSSAWGYGCWEGCQGYHQETYLFFDGERFNTFEYGAHHAVCIGMWDINPRSINEKEAVSLTTSFVEHIRKDEDVYKDEAEDFINSLELNTIKYCEKHGYYFDYGYGCEDCEADQILM